MPDSERGITVFLDICGWSDATRTPLAGDASRRRYERLRRKDGSTAVLMIAPPEAGEDTRPFVVVARYLEDWGFSAPRLYAQDHASGLLLMEDLGDDLFARIAARDPSQEAEMYRAAIDVLVSLHERPPHQSMGSMGRDTLCHLARLAGEWYGKTGKCTYLADLETLLDQSSGLTSVTILRDYHAENLVWLPVRKGIKRVGLLDFQDAARGHRAYDVVSLLEDARRDVRPDVRDEMILRYTNAANVSQDGFARDMALLGAQRNLRIIGIFARLARRDGKPNYIDLIPRVWGHLMRDLSHPSLKQLRKAVLHDLPKPTPTYLTDMAAA